MGLFFGQLQGGRVNDHFIEPQQAAKQDEFEYTELVYNPKRMHTNNGMLSPVDFEIRQQKLTKAGF